MKSRADLQRRVIVLCGELFPGQIATADDIATVDALIDGKISELARRRVMYIPDPERIDDEVFPQLAILVANEARADFGQPRDEAAGARAELRLREMQVEVDPGETVRACYF